MTSYTTRNHATWASITAPNWAWFFNPGYEASIATKSNSYTPPQSVLKFRQDLATLPLYLAHSKAQVIVPKKQATDYPHPQLISHLPDDLLLQPWGWAPELTSIFTSAQLKYATVDTEYLCSRMRSVELWHSIYNQSPETYSSFTAPCPLNQINIAKLANRNWVIKEDFTSSGRGVTFLPSTEDISRDILKRIGHKSPQLFFIEPWYQVVQNRGYEFYLDPKGNITYIGTSHFLTSRGKYIGNQLTGKDSLEKEWEDMPTQPSHQEYIQHLVTALTSLDLKGYSGPLGIDTAVILSADRQLRIVPCFEVNIRPTMGHLSIALSERYFHEERRQGRFYIQHLRNKGEVAELQEECNQHIPLYMSEAPPTSGLYPLTPISPNSTFVALLQID